MSYLLDTNIVTAILKQSETIQKKLRHLYRRHQSVCISGITYYEIKRGLLAVNASRQLAEFQGFCQRVKVLLVDDIQILEKASTIYADLKQQGQLIQDADILIAATAITHHLILVSNDSDLQRIHGLTLENWLQ